MLKELTFDQKRIRRIEGLLSTLKNYRWYGGALGHSKYNYQDTLNSFKNLGSITSNDLNEYLHFKYGRPEQEEDIEWKLVQIIGMNNLITRGVAGLDVNLRYKIKQEIIHENVLKTIEEYIPEYKISLKGMEIENYKPKEFKTIIDNIKNIPSEKAESIKDLLKPNLSEKEIMGCITKTYTEFETIKPQDLKNLSETDRNIYKKVWEFAKHLANKVVRHENNSKLTSKDIAYNYALNVSLIMKLIEMNKIN